MATFIIILVPVSDSMLLKLGTTEFGRHKMAALISSSILIIWGVRREFVLTIDSIAVVAVETVLTLPDVSRRWFSDKLFPVPVSHGSSPAPPLQENSGPDIQCKFWISLRRFHMFVMVLFTLSVTTQQRQIVFAWFLLFKGYLINPSEIHQLMYYCRRFPWNAVVLWFCCLRPLGSKEMYEWAGSLRTDVKLVAAFSQKQCVFVLAVWWLYINSRL